MRVCVSHKPLILTYHTILLAPHTSFCRPSHSHISSSLPPFRILCTSVCAPTCVVICYIVCIFVAVVINDDQGELSNAQLVGKYGFCLPHNPFDEVQLCDTWAAFISTAAAAGAATGGGGGRSSSRSSKSSTASGFKPSQKLKQHVKWLQQHRCVCVYVLVCP